jgi:hypothetical protein
MKEKDKKFGAKRKIVRSTTFANSRFQVDQSIKQRGEAEPRTFQLTFEI